MLHAHYCKASAVGKPSHFWMIRSVTPYTFRSTRPRPALYDETRTRSQDHQAVLAVASNQLLASALMLKLHYVPLSSLNIDRALRQLRTS